VDLTKSQITTIKRILNDADVALICDNLQLKYTPFNNRHNQHSGLHQNDK